MPIVVATGLALLAIGNLVWRCAATSRRARAPTRKAILLILGGLAALIALIGLGGGFIPATAILFATTAAAFGRRAFLTDLAIGFVLGVVVYPAVRQAAHASACRPGRSNVCSEGPPWTAWCTRSASGWRSRCSRSTCSMH